MATGQVATWRRWQDWAALVIGVLVALSPIVVTTSAAAPLVTPASRVLGVVQVGQHNGFCWELLSSALQRLQFQSNSPTNSGISGRRR
jgi:hypothetical protein